MASMAGITGIAGMVLYENEEAGRNKTQSDCGHGGHYGHGSIPDFIFSGK